MLFNFEMKGGFLGFDYKYKCVFCELLLYKGY